MSDLSEGADPGDGVVFRILGPVEVVGADGRGRTISGRQHAVLATLLLAANHVVSVDQLVAAVWKEEPPHTARAQVQFCISALRHMFVRRRVLAHIETQAPGYKIRLEPGQLDSQVFESRVAAARALSRDGSAAESAAAFRLALTLWRGAPLEGAAPSLRAKTVRLEELHNEVLRECADLELELGRHRELVGELRMLVAAQPLNEGLRAQLMVALTRSGRHSDALAVYREGRAISVDQLGLDPGAELRRLEAAILGSDTESLEAARPAAAPTAPPAAVIPVPRQLPAGIADFTGRTALVRSLTELLTGQPRAAGGRALAVVALTGPPGIGKSALSVHVGHQLPAEAFPDGQLYADLGGAHHPPVIEVLTRFLHALGVADSEIPQTDVECADLYRTLLAGRRVLILLDNVDRDAQVNLLLPGNPACAVLITSREPLTRLAGAHQVRIGRLTHADTVAVLGAMIGDGRVTPQTTDLAVLADAIDGLPIAARVVGVQLAAHPHWTLPRMVRRLRDDTHMLDELEFGDWSVRRALREAYETLEPGEAELLRLLALLPGDSMPSWVPRAALGDTEPVAEDLLDGLVHAQLLRVQHTDGTHEPRYRLHRLVRAAIRESLPVAGSCPPVSEEAATAASRRVAGGWLALALHAGQRLMSTAALVRLRSTPPAWEPPAEQFHEAGTDPSAWFATEHTNLKAMVVHTAQLGWDELSLALRHATDVLCRASRPREGRPQMGPRSHRRGATSAAVDSVPYSPRCNWDYVQAVSRPAHSI
jgi:DNA-binding SARP family transcriptional activator